MAVRNAPLSGHSAVARNFNKNVNSLIAFRQIPYHPITWELRTQKLDEPSQEEMEVEADGSEESVDTIVVAAHEHLLSGSSQQHLCKSTLHKPFPH